MDDIFGIIVLVTLFVLSVFGVTHLAMDFRDFSEMESQCRAQGYIQDKTTRILCSIEGKP
jgi:hypothetical protein